MRTNAGNDWQSALMGQAAGLPANFMALTEDTASPAGGDTTLPGELAASGGGLSRKQATYAHTTAAASYTLSSLFTMNAADGTNPRKPAKFGLFTAASGGTMPFETLIPSVPTLQPGDATAVSDTVNI